MQTILEGEFEFMGPVDSHEALTLFLDSTSLLGRFTMVPASISLDERNPTLIRVGNQLLMKGDRIVLLPTNCLVNIHTWGDW